MKNNLLPKAFISTINEIMPSEFSLEEFEKICHQPLRKSIRVNTLKCSIERFKELADEQSWQLEPIPWCNEGFWILDESSTPLGNAFEHMAVAKYDLIFAQHLLHLICLLEKLKYMQKDNPNLLLKR